MIDLSNIIYECSLPYLQRIGQKWHCRCIVCGDSQKSRTKKRFWFLPNKSGTSYTCYCHNCGYNESLSTFLKQYFPDVYKNYIRLRIKNRQESRKEVKENIIIEEVLEQEIIQPTISLKKICDLPYDHEAHKYLDGRKIPIKFKKYFFYSDNFKAWVHELFPDKFKHPVESDRRICIPFYTREGKLFAIAGRALDPNDELRYITIKFDENHPKIFGLERVNFNQTVYILEGQIDSLFVPNAVAMGGSMSNLQKLLDYAPVERFITIPDIEPRNKEVCRFIEDSLKLGFKVCLLPHSLKRFGKDLNAIYVKSGLTKRELFDIINSNIVSGIQGRIKFNQWRRIK